MENKIFQKSISIDCVFYGFDLEIGLHLYFHYKPFPGLKHAKREREREREREKRELLIHLKSIAPQHPRRHLDRTTIEIAPQANRTPPRLHHHRRPIHPKPISSAPSLPMTDLISISSPSLRYPWLISLPSRSRRYPWPISSRSCHPWPISSPMTHDWSLPFPQFLITLSSSLSQFDRIVEFNEWCCFDFCFFKFIYWNFYYKICLVVEKMWESSRKIAFSECSQTHENIF